MIPEKYKKLVKKSVKILAILVFSFFVYEFLATPIDQGPKKVGLLPPQQLSILEKIAKYLTASVSGSNIILISGANELDSDRKIIADVYDKVSKQDGVYVTIPSGNYVRATFERELTNTNDITLYAKGTGTIEVYKKDSTEKIMSFDISGEKKYTQLLTDMSGTSDSFDLKSVGDISYDFITDPGSCTGTAPSSCGLLSVNSYGGGPDACNTWGCTGTCSGTADCSSYSNNPTNCFGWPGGSIGCIGSCIGNGGVGSCYNIWSATSTCHTEAGCTQQCETYWGFEGYCSSTYYGNETGCNADTSHSCVWDSGGGACHSTDDCSNYSFASCPTANSICGQLCDGSFDCTAINPYSCMDYSGPGGCALDCSGTSSTFCQTNYDSGGTCSDINGCNSPTCAGTVTQTCSVFGQSQCDYTYPPANGWVTDWCTWAGASAPTVTVSPATGLTPTGATLNGNVTDIGGENPDVKVYWGTTDRGPWEIGWDGGMYDFGTLGVTAFSHAISGLSLGTQYYFRAEATNSGGTSWSDVSSFKIVVGLNQEHFQIFNDDVSLNGATAMAGQDMNYNVPLSTNFCIRFETANTGTVSETFSRLLLVSRNGGTFGAISNFGQPEDVTLSPSGNFSDGAATTSRLTSVGTFTAGQGKYAGGSTDPVVLGANYNTEDEYCLQFKPSAQGTTYQFKIVNVTDSIDLDFYTAIPSIFAGPANVFDIKGVFHGKGVLHVK